MSTETITYPTNLEADEQNSLARLALGVIFGAITLYSRYENGILAEQDAAAGRVPCATWVGDIPQGGVGHRTVCLDAYTTPDGRKMSTLLVDGVLVCSQSDLEGGARETVSVGNRCAGFTQDTDSE